MSLLQDYTDLFQHFSEQHTTWTITSDKPFTLSRALTEDSLPLSICLYGDDDSAHVYFNLYGSKGLTEIAEKLLKLKQEQQIQKKDEESGLVIMIDSDGFAVIFNASDVTPEEFSGNLEDLIGKSEALLLKVVETAHEIIQDIHEKPATESVSAGSIDQIIEQYFASEEYKYEHDKISKSFVFGFSTENYVNQKGTKSLRIVIDYSDNDLLRFTTPFLYQFDLQKTDYSLIASVTAWFQFEYKYLAMSLDPSDGELKISIDIPMGTTLVHASQIKRIVSFILQFTESTYDELFALLLNDSQVAKEKLNLLIDTHKGKIANLKWHESIKSKLDGLTDAQKKAIDDILNQASGKTSELGGI